MINNKQQEETGEAAITKTRAYYGDLNNENNLLIGCGGFTAYQFLTNSECYKMFCYSEGMGAKVHVREGKNPWLASLMELEFLNFKL